MKLEFNNIIFYLLITTILLDVFLGSLRALNERKWNSTIGINGILRKTAMIGSSIFLIIIDSILKIDLLFFIPKEITETIKLNEIGIFELFALMFILYETTSILKNMILCGLPIPKRLKSKIEKLLNDLTSETGGDKNE
jgi:toxin secretion/phage lysis holin